jgi:hypothetical protein
MTSLDSILAEVIRARVQAETAERTAKTARKALQSLQRQIERAIVESQAGPPDHLLKG